MIKSPLYPSVYTDRAGENCGHIVYPFKKCVPFVKTEGHQRIHIVRSGAFHTDKEDGHYCHAYAHTWCGQIKFLRGAREVLHNKRRGRRVTRLLSALSRKDIMNICPYCPSALERFLTRQFKMNLKSWTHYYRPFTSAQWKGE